MSKKTNNTELMEKINQKKNLTKTKEKSIGKEEDGEDMQYTTM